jgi:ATP synthase protein I
MTPEKDRSSWREVGAYAQLGTTFVMCVVVGLVGGYYADRWLGTEPSLLLVGLGLGIAAGFWNFYRAIKALSHMADDERHEPDGDQ